MTMKTCLPKYRVLFVCKRRHSSYGISVGLINSATFVSNVLNHHGIESKVAIVHDANGIDREVYQFKPTHIIIEALWVTPAKMDVLLQMYRKQQWVVRIHSKAAFIANEGIAFEWLSEYAHRLVPKHKNLLLSSNNAEFNEELSELMGIAAVYLPNIYQPRELLDLPAKKSDQDVIDIGCFGAIRPLKNQLVQAIAAIRFGNRLQKKIRFHINAERVEHGENVLRNLRATFRYSNHELVEHGWLAHADFLKLVRKMDIGMQVSLSESFNIVAADMVIEDVPVVVSDEINWLPWICQADPKDSEDIIDKLFLAYHGRKFGITILNRWALRYNNFVNTKIWMAYFVKYFFDNMDRRTGSAKAAPKLSPPARR